jgi:hypothetical protein
MIATSSPLTASRSWLHIRSEKYGADRHCCNGEDYEMQRVQREATIFLDRTKWSDGGW